MIVFKEDSVKALETQVAAGGNDGWRRRFRAGKDLDDLEAQARRLDQFSEKVRTDRADRCHDETAYLLEQVRCDLANLPRGSNCRKFLERCAGRMELCMKVHEQIPKARMVPDDAAAVAEFALRAAREIDAASAHQFAEGLSLLADASRTLGHAEAMLEAMKKSRAHQVKGGTSGNLQDMVHMVLGKDGGATVKQVVKALAAKGIRISEKTVSRHKDTFVRARVLENAQESVDVLAKRFHIRAATIRKIRDR